MTPNFTVVILSCRGEVAQGCVQSVLAHETLRPEQIVVVDDGASTSWKGDERMTWIAGKKPFVFSRNANLGIRWAQSDVILMNDDSRLMTERGFTKMHREVSGRRGVGVCSAAIEGHVGNPQQKALSGSAFREVDGTAAFVCVLIPRPTITRVGFLDEAFTGYGSEDVDYCERVREHGLSVNVYDGCRVSHGKIKPTFSVRPDFIALRDRNREVLRQKRQKRSGGAR